MWVPQILSGRSHSVCHSRRPAVALTANGSDPNTHFFFSAPIHSQVQSEGDGGSHYSSLGAAAACIKLQRQLSAGTTSSFRIIPQLLYYVYKVFSWLDERKKKYLGKVKEKLSWKHCKVANNWLLFFGQMVLDGLEYYDKKKLMITKKNNHVNNSLSLKWCLGFTKH